MKTTFLFIIAFVFLAVTTHAEELAKLSYSTEGILDYVLAKKKLARNPEIPLPELHLKSQTSLEVFQSSLVDQWNFLPEIITNVYSVKTNRIFLMDDKAYYDDLKRCIDDSLAHELTHYVQVMYQKWDHEDESLEWDAVDIQTQFREDFCSKHENSRIQNN